MKKLRVVYEGWGEKFDLGVLADDGRRILFEYTEEGIRRGIELSPHSLPLRAGAAGDFPHFQSRLPGLISDSLPDGWGLLVMDKLMRARGIDTRQLSPLDRLAFLGNNTMGALTYHPATEEPLPKQTVDLLILAEESQKILEGKSSDVLREYVILGGSPHGARPKVLVNIDPATDKAWTTERSPGIPWLVKFPGDGEHHEVCAIEKLYADMAQQCDLAIPQTRYFELGRESDIMRTAFAIQRFDRQQYMRVPIHTVAGAAHVDFRIPSSLDYLNLLRLTRAITRDVREVKSAFERCVFNVVLNNRDDHPKNFSFRMEQEGQWRISPAYDVTFCHGPGGEHQMDVFGEARAITRTHLMKLAHAADIPAADAGHVIDRVTEIAGRFAKLATDYPIRTQTVREIVKAVEANRTRMAGRTQGGVTGEHTQAHDLADDDHEEVEVPRGPTR